MARTTDYLTFMVDVTPYEHEGNNYNALNIIVAYYKGRGFVITWQPVKKTDMGYMTGPMPSSDPLVGGKGFVAKAATRNSVKVLETMKAALRQAKDGIKFYFDQRDYDGLKSFMTDAANYGYSPMLEERLMGDRRKALYFPTPQPTNSNNQPTNPLNNQPTMKLNINANNTESKNTVANTAAAIVTPLGTHGTLVIGRPGLTPAKPIEDADFEEVPQSAPSNQNTSTTPSNLPQVQFSTYKTKRGDTAPQIIGFGGEDDPRWKSHKDAGHKWVSASYRRDLNGNKVYILLFGVRYMDVAKALCGAYNTNDVNAWHRAEDACMAIYEQAQRDGKARWEEKKQQWAEKKAEKAAQKAADEQAKKCYTKEDVAAMLADVLAGKDVPEDIKKLLAA